jgi:hypothetical protein
MRIEGKTKDFFVRFSIMLCSKTRKITDSVFLVLFRRGGVGGSLELAYRLGYSRIFFGAIAQLVRAADS